MSMKNIFLFFYLISLVAFNLNAQTTLSEYPLKLENAGTDTSKHDNKKMWVGGKNFVYIYFDIGLIVGSPEGDGSDILYGNSTNFAAGFRYFNRINKFYRIGFDIGHDGYSYSLKQDSSKILPNNQINNTERITLNNLNISFVNRFSFGKKNNRMGTYIDIGGFAGWTHTSINYTLNKHQIVNAANASKTQVYNRALVFVNDYHYGVMAGFGKNYFRFYAKYRLSDNFKSQYIYAELPRITIGIELALHQ